jgi:hypothetical protein
MNDQQAQQSKRGGVVNELMDEAKRRRDEVFHGPKPEPPPPPPPRCGIDELSTNRPIPADDDLYLQPGGGFGSRSEDELEARRQASELRAAAVRREARNAEAQEDPARQRILELERRLAELEGQGGKSSPEQEARGFDERRDRTSGPPGVQGEWSANISRPQ